MADVHAHRDLVRFINGAEVTAVSLLSDEPYQREQPPSFGLYFDRSWTPPWPHDHVAWPDFGVPSDAESLRSSLTDLLDRAGRGERVEVGCLGGHGRTGTALGCLAALTGTPAAEAVSWVRATYCSHAVETEAQATFVEAFTRES